MALDEPLGLLVAAVRRRLKQYVSSLVGDPEVTPQQFWTVVAIAEHEGLSLRELAERRHMDQPTACRIVASLTRRRHVRSRRDPADRRRTRLELTPSGREMAARFLPVAERVREAVTDSLTPEERHAVASGLHKIIAGLDRLEAAGPAARTARLE
jgi:MarR family transcriptional regulator, lower aerobic nicotinate degradation pathway regulator